MRRPFVGSFFLFQPALLSQFPDAFTLKGLGLDPLSAHRVFRNQRLFGRHIKLLLPFVTLKSVMRAHIKAPRQHH
jgi:hypothetical protein